MTKDELDALEKAATNPFASLETILAFADAVLAQPSPTPPKPVRLPAIREVQVSEQRVPPSSDYVTREEFLSALDFIAEHSGEATGRLQKLMHDEDQFIRAELEKLRSDLVQMVSREFAALPATVTTALKNKNWKNNRRNRDAVQ